MVTHSVVGVSCRGSLASPLLVAPSSVTAAAGEGSERRASLDNIVQSVCNPKHSLKLTWRRTSKSGQSRGSRVSSCDGGAVAGTSSASQPAPCSRSPNNLAEAIKFCMLDMRGTYSMPRLDFLSSQRLGRTLASLRLARSIADGAWYA
ncbi:hypothetical protein B566_EDAN002956 [Ephemera danica]|nr:hypothetical protein B566_EDAN002956 [Ephemera danica]